LEWTGINQNKANRYVEYFLRTGMFNTMLYPDFPAATAAPHHVEPEVQVGDSRIDFEVDESILIEVKTPLIHIPCENHPKFRLDIRDGKFDSANRIVKHFRALADIMEQPERRVYRQTACSRKRKRNQPQKVVSKYFQPHRRRRCIFLICQLYDAEPFRRPPVTGRIQIITDASMRAKECM
jgi:sugar fermentation stimulation protein A